MRPLRVDDFGSCSKAYEQYASPFWASVGPLKRLYGLKGWGPYHELDPWLIEALCASVDATGGSFTVAVTACWVKRDGTMVPYPEKFPEQAATIKRWVDRGTVEVANHGLTHCVVGKHLPRFWGHNRTWHREFYADLPRDLMVEHLWWSQSILRDWLGVAPATLVPPGSVWRTDLDGIAATLGLTVWRPEWPCEAWHDRDFLIPGGLERWQMMLADETFTTCGEWSKTPRFHVENRGGPVTIVPSVTVDFRSKQ